MEIRKRNMKREIKISKKNTANKREVGEIGGSIVEYALILGFAIFIFIVVVSLILSIVDWTQSNMNDFLNGVSS